MRCVFLKKAVLQNDHSCRPYHPKELRLYRSKSMLIKALISAQLPDADCYRNLI
ncbi:unknown protein [Waddlia chondrophila 2032/99]|uniref:Uncharacterized protein n=1 Tax=Waddlia chondrophila 2032/99 TaxID=765953 RepID=F8LB14_9BACT|nr:unknown protein [Waddlia chondrophila 2032/99]